MSASASSPANASASASGPANSRRRGNRRTIGGFALLVAVLGLFSPLFLAGPASAAPIAKLSVSGLQTTAGQLKFVLSGTGLPAGTDLAKSELTVTVGGTKLETTVATTAATQASDLPARAVVIAVDTGASMAGAQLAAVQQAVTAYLDGLPVDVAVGLVTFGDKAQTVLPPSYDRNTLRTAVAAITARGGNTLYDGIRQSAELFSGDYAERRVLAFADSSETGTTGAAEATAALIAHSAALDLMVLGSAQPGQAATIATGSGGQAQQPADANGLAAAASALATTFIAPVVVTAKVPTALSGQIGTATIAVNVGGTAVTTSTPVSFVVDPAAVPALQSGKVGVLSHLFLYGGLGAIALAVLIAATAIMSGLLGQDTLSKRLREIDNFGKAQPGAPVTHSASTAEGSVVVRTALGLSEKAAERQGINRLEGLLDRAGIALRPAEWMLTRAGIAGLGGVVGLLLLSPILGLLLGAVAGWFATGWFLKWRIKRRATRFGDLLPEALQLVVGALRSGFSLGQSLDAVVREGPEPVSGEIGRAMAEIRLGGDLEDALERCAERNSSTDLAWLVMAIRIQREVGGNLSEVMETAVETMRERGRVMRHVRSLSAEGRLSAYVLIGMPIALSVWLFLTRRDYLRPLYSTPIGIALLLAAVVMVALGAFTINRMIKVEV